MEGLGAFDAGFRFKNSHMAYVVEGESLGSKNNLCFGLSHFTNVYGIQRDCIIDSEYYRISLQVVWGIRSILHFLYAAYAFCRMAYLCSK